MFKNNKSLSSSPPAFAAVQPPLAPSVLAAPPVMSTSHKGGARNLTRKVVRTVKRILNKLRPRRRKDKKGEPDTSEPIAFAAAIPVSVSIASLSEDTSPTGDVLTPSGSILDDSALLFLAASISISGHDDFTPSLTVSRRHSTSAFYPQSLPATLPMLSSCLPMPKDAYILTSTADSVMAPDAVHCHEEEPLSTEGELTAPSLDFLCSVDLDNGDLYHLDIDISSERSTKPSNGQSTSKMVGSALPPALGNFVSGSSSGQPIAEGSDRSSRSCTSVGLKCLAPAPVSSSQAQLCDFPSFSRLSSISELTNDEQPSAIPSPASDRSSASESRLHATTTQAIQSNAEAQSDHPFSADDMAPCVSVGSFLCMAEAAEFSSKPKTTTEVILSSAKAPLDTNYMAHCASIGILLCMAEASVSVPVHATDAVASQELRPLPDISVHSFEHPTGSCMSLEVSLTVDTVTTDVLPTSMATSISIQSTLSHLPSSDSLIDTGLLSLAFSTIDVEALISFSEVPAQVVQPAVSPPLASISVSISASSTQVICVPEVGLLSLAFSTLDVEALISFNEATAQVTPSAVPSPSASTSSSISDFAVLYPLPPSTHVTSVSSSVCNVNIASSGEVFPHPVGTAIASLTPVSATTCVPVIPEQETLANSEVTIPEFINTVLECNNLIPSLPALPSRTVAVFADLPEHHSTCTCQCSAPAKLKIYASISIQTDLLESPTDSDAPPPPAPPAPPPPPMYKSPPPVKIKIRGRNGQLVSLDIRREGLDGMFLTELTSLLAAQADGGPRVLRKTERAEDKYETAVGGEIVLKKTDFQVGTSRRGDEDQEKVKIRTKEEWGKTVKRRPITMKENATENAPSLKPARPTRTKETALNDITNTARAETPFLSELETAIARSRGGRPLLTPIPVLEDKGEEESAQSTSPWGPRLRGRTPNNAISKPSPPRRNKKLELELTALSSGRRIPEGGMSLAAMAICERLKAEKKMQEDAAAAASEGA